MLFHAFFMLFICLELRDCTIEFALNSAHVTKYEKQGEARLYQYI